ncbi:MAG: hypothetical protein PHE10_03105 [Kiritimatiellae bacterium]|nr:hypothetical protein [Kiritimatiellia bacterium]MDD4024957.1 hypothetical protein [Kiritimatiellia bacterium]
MTAKLMAAVSGKSLFAIFRADPGYLISDDGRLKVEGQTSSFHLGFTPAMCGAPDTDHIGRLTTPDIQSIEMKMKYS